MDFSSTSLLNMKAEGTNHVKSVRACVCVYVYVYNLVGFCLKSILASSSPFCLYLIDDVDSFLIFVSVFGQLQKKNDAKKITFDYYMHSSNVEFTL